MNDDEDPYAGTVCSNDDEDHSCRIEVGPRIILEPPPHYNALLRRLGGLSRNGLPMWRLVWGWSRLAFIGGVEYRLADTGITDPRTGQEVKVNEIVIQPTRLAPKYWPYPNRWYLEEWNPPEIYGSPERWEANFTTYVPEIEPGVRISGPYLLEGTPIEQLGPYPSRGEYESRMMWSGFEDEPLPLFALEMGLGFIKKAGDLTGKARVARLKRQIEAEEHRAKMEQLKTIEEFAEAEVPNWDGTVSIPTAGAYNPAMKKGLVN